MNSGKTKKSIQFIGIILFVVVWCIYLGFRFISIIGLLNNNRNILEASKHIILSNNTIAYLHEGDIYVKNDYRVKKLELPQCIDFAAYDVLPNTCAEEEKTINQKELLMLTTNQLDATIDGMVFGEKIEIYTFNPNTLTCMRVYTNNISVVKPWSISVGEMDGDKDIEIFIGAYRETEFYEEARRPFIFSWNGSFIYKKWTGSYLVENDFLNASLQDVNEDGIDELVAYEGDKEKGYLFNAYMYNNHTLYKIGEVDKKNKKLLVKR